MKSSDDAVRGYIEALQFAPAEGESGIFRKCYRGGYHIDIDLPHGRIKYDAVLEHGSIKCWGSETCNFSHAENLVELECIDRLLTIGYPAECIELEKVYPSGRGHSGRTDILVKTVQGEPFLIIECKTPGAEYEAELRRMQRDGGQLFAYYTQERSVRYLCLYASHVEDGTVSYCNAVIDVDSSWAGLSGTQEIYTRWNKLYKDGGIFDADAVPYNIRHKALRYADLRGLSEEDSGKIYNQIMEILRHNVISDKPNAFNKLLNLFVCKIIDEDRNGDEQVGFQWLETDTDVTLQMRLEELYRAGMKIFLDIDIEEYSRDKFEQTIAPLGTAERQWLMQLYTDLAIKRDATFAFVEALDDRSANLNAGVLREIVELLQPYKFRYEQRHEFLGNFFELLLNTSMKQEAGQFFTPVPITRFILMSLPLRKIVKKRIDSRNPEPLPAVIDFACGSGHFLTEYMSQMQTIIDSDTGLLDKASPDTKRQFKAWSDSTKFAWAKDTVYGIDLDKRLVKTAKVSAFFNGDGDANIIWANGLDSFSSCDAYHGKLKKSNGRDNGQFDILISNPPYAVEAFKGTIPSGDESFVLYNYLTDNSSEIECLFIERMKQLLRVGGIAAIVLPVSILSKGGIYISAREILLKYFRFKATVELGAGTFMKTGTNTVVFFLERRSEADSSQIETAIKRFWKTWADFTVSGIENAFSCFVNDVYPDLTFDDYCSIFNGDTTEVATHSRLYRDYQAALGDGFRDSAIATESEKMLYYMLSYRQEIVRVQSGTGKDIKKFLGYEFRETRGHEGLHWLYDSTMLYDEQDPSNPQKVCTYINYAFNGEYLPIDEALTSNVSYVCLSDIIEYGTSTFTKTINPSKTKATVTHSRYPMAALGEIADIVIGATPSRDNPEYFRGDHPWVSVGELNGNIIRDTREKITDDAVENSSVKLIPEGKTLLSFKLSIGKVAFSGVPLYTNEAIAALLPKDNTVVLDKYLFYLFKSGRIDLKGIKSGNVFGKSLNTELLKREVRIPLPPLDVQQQIVDEITQREEEIEKLQQESSRLKALQEDLVGHITAI